MICRVSVTYMSTLLGGSFQHILGRKQIDVFIVIYWVSYELRAKLPKASTRAHSGGMCVNTWCWFFTEN